MPRSLALRTDPAARATRVLRKRARVVDLSSIFCDEESCFPVLGNSLVYFDDNHITDTFSKTLWPHFMRIFDKPKQPQKAKK